MNFLIQEEDSMSKSSLFLKMIRMIVKEQNSKPIGWMILHLSSLKKQSQFEEKIRKICQPDLKGISYF